MSRLFGMPFAKVYPLYLAKVERKGHDQAELDTVIRWLLDIDDATLARHLEEQTTFEQLFDQVRLNPASEKITGMILRDAGRADRGSADAEDPLPRQGRG